MILENCIAANLNIKSESANNFLTQDMRLNQLLLIPGCTFSFLGFAFQSEELKTEIGTI